MCTPMDLTRLGPMPGIIILIKIKKIRIIIIMIIIIIMRIAADALRGLAAIFRS